MAYIQFEGLPEGTEYRRLVEGLAKYGLEVTHELNFDPSQMHVAKFNISEGSWARLKHVAWEEMNAKILAGMYEAGLRIAPSGSGPQALGTEVPARFCVELIDTPGHANRTALFSNACFDIVIDSPYASALPQDEDPPRGSVAWANKVLGVTGS